MSIPISRHHEGDTHQKVQPRTLYRDVGMLQKSLAPVTSADQFKSPEMLNKPRASVEIYNFFSHEARLRQPSSLKAGSAGLPLNIISLSTGRPSPDTYPFHAMDFTFTDPQLGAALEAGVTAKSCPTGFQTRTASVARNEPAAAIDIAIALSYGYSLGHEQLIQYLTTHISLVHSPPYSDWEVCLTVGNTSALEITLRNFANPGDSILVEEYTYSGAIEVARPLGISLIPTQMDNCGPCPSSLERTLSSWAVDYPGRPKPRILYTIPTGQNPTGITQPLERRLAILKVAEAHDLLVLEDDPYYYLQFPKSDDSYFSTIIPSYLALCRTGRVIRLDSTSKILAPGLRLGWLTAPKTVVEAYQASHDLGVVHPSGLSQLVTFKLLSETWGHGGFEEWLQSLAQHYQHKANGTLHACRKLLGTGPLGTVCSWSTIQAGMFIWLKISCAQYPRLNDKFQTTKSIETIRLEIEDEIYSNALERGVLCSKGSFFEVPALPRSARAKTEEQSSTELSTGHRRGWQDLNVHFRLTFASEDETDVVKGLETLAGTLKDIFEL